MYPTLPYLIKDLTGIWIPIPIATFGLFLVIAFYTGAYLLKKEIIRKEKGGLINAFTDNKGISRQPHEVITNLIIYTIIWGLIGARIFSILEYPKPFLAHPFKTMFSMGGLTFYGGFIFGGIAGLYNLYKRKIKLLPVFDAAAPVLMLGYAIGRIGCHLSGDGDWGIDNLAVKPSWLSFLPDWAWAYKYPHNAIDAGIKIKDCTGEFCHILLNPVYPTPLYEVIICFVLFCLLWFLRKKIQLPGILFSIFLIVNGIERFLIEKIRVDSEYKIFNHLVKQAEIISVLLILLGISGIVYLKSRKKSV